MGLSVEQFAALTPFSFQLKCIGLRDYDRLQESFYRKLGWITYAVSSDPKSKMTIDDVWPIADKKPVKPQAGLFDKKQINKLLADFRKNKDK